MAYAHLTTTMANLSSKSHIKIVIETVLRKTIMKAGIFGLKLHIKMAIERVLRNGIMKMVSFFLKYYIKITANRT